MDNVTVDSLPDPVGATARVNGTRVSLLGWGRAILLQLAHPLVAAGVAEHSGFTASALAPVARLHGTVRAMLAFSFGSDADVAGAAAVINRIHDRVHGRLAAGAGRFGAGTPYSAHDPDLLLWVHVTLLDSMPLAYRTFAAPLDDDAHDAYCRESVRSARPLGLEADRVPATRAELDATIARGLEHDVAVTDTARALARTILTPPFAAILPGATLHRLAAVGLLPPAIRDAYGFTWTDDDARALARWSARLRRWHARAPTRLTTWRAARRAPTAHPR